jgi:hypothetical protein
MATASVLDWTADDVAIWLRGNGHEKYINLLCQIHRIDGKALLLLAETDFRTAPLNIQVDFNENLCNAFKLADVYFCRDIKYFDQKVEALGKLKSVSLLIFLQLIRYVFWARAVYMG